ncbi:MAG: glycosyltransferase [Muribaculaceae bacterium]|nr:glycosyltransferase [Muribaculaceae bacterium]
MTGISVIVVTYNQESTIARTLDSILSQRIDNAEYEIVIGDDCSTDGTSDLCREYERRHPGVIRYFRRERNLGLVDNYYQCLREARGEFIADCAGDDFWVDDRKLAKEYKLMVSDSEITLVHTGWMECDEDGGNCRLPGISNDYLYTGSVAGRGTLTSALMRREKSAMVHLCTAMYRKSAIMKWMDAFPALFDSGKYRCEDFQIITLLSSSGKIGYIPDVTLHYTVKKDSISHPSDFRKKYLQVESDIRLTENIRQVLNLNEEVVIDSYDAKLDYLCSQAIHSGDATLRDRYFELQLFLPDGGKKSLKRKVKEIILGRSTLCFLYRMIFSKTGECLR